jgi:hypothetical protein
MRARLCRPFFPRSLTTLGLCCVGGTQRFGLTLINARNSGVLQNALESLRLMVAYLDMYNVQTRENLAV